MKQPKHFLCAFAATFLLSGCATQPLTHVSDDARYDALTSDTLTPFKSETEFLDWLQKADRLEAKRQKTKRAMQGDEEDYIVLTGSRAAPPPNITNIQNIGVDEGDIVKQVGDHLVLMQDGRLFSLDIEPSTPVLTARVDIYDKADENIWYDELLVSGRRIVVTGYHYGKHATEISIFNLDANGQFTRQGRWYLESEDYYSDDNSATRMIGDTLIFHNQGDVSDPEYWPVLREENQSRVKSILRASDIYPPVLRMNNPTLHMVTECKIGQTLDCKTRAVMAPGRAEWIVTEDAGYLWAASPRPNWYMTRVLGQQSQTQPSTLYRFPIGANDVEAVTFNARLGSRFAFEARDNRILALVAQELEDEEYNLALLDISKTLFSKRPVQISQAGFTPLPGEETYGVKMRYTANHLVYSNVIEGDPVAYVLDLETRSTPARIAVPHEIGRVDRVGENAILIGYGEDGLGISWIDLASAPTLTDTLSLAKRFESEGRAQALNMRVKANGSALIGLPTYFDGTNPDGYNFEEEGGTDISFSRVSSFGRLSSLGTAKGRPARVDPNYKCETSCVDWYGNARPFFIGDRIFALIASELIELEEAPGGLIERSRVNLSSPIQP